MNGTKLNPDQDNNPVYLDPTRELKFMIYHITDQKSWQAAGAVYRAPSLETDGFIHCSDANQVVGTANTIFAGQDGLVLLAIDEAKLTEKLVYEDLYGHGDFPHIYGALNTDAVVDVHDFPCNLDGTFDLPPNL